MPLFKRRPKPIQLTRFSQLDELLDTGKPVLVDFFQFGCSPCQVMDGIVNELAEDFEDSAVIVKANVRDVPEAMEAFRIRSTPTFLVLTGSAGATKATQRWRASGLVKKDVLTRTLVGAGASPVD